MAEDMFQWHWFIEWGTPNSAHMYGIEKILYHGRSKYQDIMVAIVKDLGKALILDGKTQSAIIDEFVYHESLVHPAMILHGKPEKVLILGGGEGATAREVLRFKSVKRVVMVDIDEEVVKVSKEYLPEWHKGAFDDPRFELIIMDGLKYVEEANEKFDVIIADLADPLEAGPAYKLYTKEYYEKLKKLLNPGGVFVTQATSPTITTFTHAVIFNTIKSVFKYASIYHVYVRSFDGVWGFVIASDTKDPRSLTPEVIDKYLAENVEGENRFYEGIIHLSMFAVPKYLRKAIESIKDIATLEKPVFMPA
ncbi:MAG: polyamine aminopropyltransferase [Desulfurococcales archaeon]|nr:polyamine aminopropyltransferase [Desulfurococcales archaeon]MCE4629471.1 polyamine aminopropyltransferase [Desulfurococcales archaeon]